MTNRIALFLALAIIALLVADHFWLHWNIPLELGRRTVDLIEWFIFWR